MRMVRHIQRTHAPTRMHANNPYRHLRCRRVGFAWPRFFFSESKQVLSRVEVTEQVCVIV
jgi:hypothetical protein